MNKYFIICSIILSIAFGQLDKNINCDVIKLSYVKADEALGLIKSMGYNVIEFQSSESENNSDNKFTPESIVSNNQLSIIKFPDSGQGYLENSIESNDDDDDDGNDLQSYLGGSTFPILSSGTPLQRLLVCYDNNTKDDYLNLLDILRTKIDVGAKQIMIDALVLEIDSDDINKFKIEMMQSLESEGIETDFEKFLSFAWNYENLSFSTAQKIAGILDIQIDALAQSDHTEILSKPSVLVMDGRQARIQVGKQIPISKFPVTSSGSEVIIPDVEYVPIGIILNLRPRISDDGRQVTMQIETIITESDGNEAEGVLSAPIINNRKVESYVRIANNTPFIIGGLISDKNIKGKGRIPLLSKIPIIGKIFSSNYKQQSKREVIVVITPHVINEDYDQFSKVIPQDSDRFDSFGNKLFLNSYRLKESDIYDLDYITESKALFNLKNKLENGKTTKSEISKKIIDGYIPGEEVFVKRMLYDIIKKKLYSRYIDTDNVIYFDEKGDIRTLSMLSTTYGKKVKKALNKTKRQQKAIHMFFKKNNQIFERPFLSHELVTISNYDENLRELNSLNGPSILLSNSKNKRKLLNVLILKHVLELNEDLDLTLESFRPGLEIIFPSPEILEKNTLLIDKDVARFYYEINDYYHVFESEFNKEY